MLTKLPKSFLCFNIYIFNLYIYSKDYIIIEIIKYINLTVVKIDVRYFIKINVFVKK
jgi:hypothetical protein